jgi:hypothetical protein
MAQESKKHDGKLVDFSTIVNDGIPFQDFDFDFSEPEYPVPEHESAQELIQYAVDHWEYAEKNEPITSVQRIAHHNWMAILDGAYRKGLLNGPEYELYLDNNAPIMVEHIVGEDALWNQMHCVKESYKVGSGRHRLGLVKHFADLGVTLHAKGYLVEADDNGLTH